MRVELLAENGMTVFGEAAVEYLAPNRAVAKLPNAEIEWTSASSARHLADGNGVWVHRDELGYRWAAVPATGEPDVFPSEKDCVFWDLIGPGGTLMDTDTAGGIASPGELTPARARMVTLAEFGSLIAWSTHWSKVHGGDSATADPEFDATLARVGADGLLSYHEMREATQERS